jgi:DNA replication protein DnaC
MDTRPASIREILANCHLAPLTPGQKTSESDLLEQMRRDLRVSSVDHTFENFKHLPGTDMAHKAFLTMATRDDARPMLLCYGGVGNGKTFLCEALVLELYKREQFTRLFTFSEILSWLHKAMRPENGLPSVDVLVEGYCRAKRLVIDDVGMGGTGSAWEWGILEQIVGHRYRERLFTVLTTNQDIKALPERIFSRFCDPETSYVVLNEGGDYRRRDARA